MVHGGGDSGRVPRTIGERFFYRSIITTGNCQPKCEILITVRTNGFTMRGRLPDPAWKGGPTESKPTDSEHAIHPEDFGHGGFDFDGFGVDEAERVEGRPLVVIQESAECTRDGCDAVHRRRLLFTTQPLSDGEKHALDLASGVDEPGVLVHDVAERTGPETIEANGVEITAETIIEDEPTGACYGRVEPSPHGL